MRQLFSVPVWVIALASLLPLPACNKAAPPPPSPPASLTQELTAADMLATALVVRAARGEKADRPNSREVDRMSQIYGDLSQRFPHSAEVRISHGSFLWAFQNPGAAMQKWQEAAELDPCNAEAMACLGGAYLKMGDESKSTACFLKASQLEPTNASYHFSLGTNYTVFRRRIAPEHHTSPEDILISATEEFRRASEIERANSEYAKAYADAFYLLAAPDWAKALTAWSHYLEVTADKDFAYTHLARVSIKQGNDEEARSYLQHVMSASFAGVKSALLRRIDSGAGKPVENREN